MTAIAIDATHCAACGRPLTDETSIRLAIGPDCRADLGYDPAKLQSPDREEADDLLHKIASGKLTTVPLRSSLFRLSTIGLGDLAKRIDQRFTRRIVQAELRAMSEAQSIVPNAPAIPTPKPFQTPFTLTAGQDQAREAVHRIMAKPGFALLVIAGYAGVGKSTLIGVFAQEWGELTVITPTGKAALRVTEATGLKASTVHRWLYKPRDDEKTGATQFTRRALEDIPKTKSRIVVLDEASMVAKDLWTDIYNTCKQLDLKLVCVGDGFQLPPVQADNLPPFSILAPSFAQVLSAERVEMTEVLRQAQGSPVIRASMALRQGIGLPALRELPRAEYAMIQNVAVATHQNGGVTICHRNQTRFHLNAGIRTALGILDEQPQPGEPMMVLRNNYVAGLMNGETIRFEGWQTRPEGFERVTDRWKGTQEDTRFGATTIGGIPATLSLEELHGRLTVATRSIEFAANRWARVNGQFTAGDSVAPHVHANFGYAYTSHKSQGSQWPWVFVVIEPSVRFDEENGLRWIYTAITRAQNMASYYLGKLY